MIQAKDVSLIYRDHGREIFACDDISLDVRPGEFLGILGPSGSGKSSLLYLLSGLKTPSRGSVSFEGREIARMNDAERSRLRLNHFGFVFQQPYLLGYVTALENVMAVGPARDPEFAERARSILLSLGLGDRLGRFPHELSGGERQRVCVARALAMRPQIVFADEPTASLDHANGKIVVDLLNQHRGAGALVMVTHDPTMLERADRIVRIVDGRIAEEPTLDNLSVEKPGTTGVPGR